jgi:hypothetical protein
MAETERGLDETIGWKGLPIEGLGNKPLGRVAGIHVDAESGQPRWALIRLGRLGRCTAIPVEHVGPGAERLWAAYDRDWIRKAPRFRASESLSAGQELELCAHWEMHTERGRGAEIAGLDTEDITAVPAAS